MFDMKRFQDIRPNAPQIEINAPDMGWWDTVKNRLDSAKVPDWRPGLPAYEVQVRDTHWWKYLLAGVTLGAAGAWLISRATGGRTRVVVRDTLSSSGRAITHDLPRAASQQVGQLGDRLSGLGHQAREAIHFGGGDEPPDQDQFLKQKVETEVFGLPDVPKGDLNVNAQDGVVYVRGTVRDRELIRAILGYIEKVDGVREVVSYLKTPEEVTNLSSSDPRR